VQARGAASTLDEDGPREDRCGLVLLLERVQHSLAALPTVHKVHVQLGHAPKGCGIQPGEDLVRQQGVRLPGLQEVAILRINDMQSGTEIVDVLLSQVRQRVQHVHPHPAV